MMALPPPTAGTEPSEARPVGLPPGFAHLLGRCAFPRPGSPLSCAVSGGPDSLALLALAVAHGLDVEAVHVDHGLRRSSAAEADVVRDAARQLGARFRALSAPVPPGPNLEARARQARRSVLPRPHATGHTADDQLETVLLNLLRGAGLDGLAGMRLGPEHPLLRLRRSETHGLVAAAGLVAVRDESNDDLRFLRNRLRHELVPALGEAAGRDLAEVVGRQARLLAEEAAWLDGEACRRLPDPADARALAAAPIVLARRAVRQWLGPELGAPPSGQAVDAVLAVARGECRACELPGRLRVERRAQRLRLVRVSGARSSGAGPPGAPAGSQPGG